MRTSILSEPRAKKVKVTAKTLIVYLADGRKLEVPVVWFPRLRKATPAERNHYRFIGRGVGIHWPKIDEDISINGLLNVSKHPLVYSEHELEKKQRRSAA